MYAPRRRIRAGRWRSSATTTTSRSGPYGVGSKIRDATIDRHRGDARLPGLRRRAARVPRAARPAGRRPARRRRRGRGRRRRQDPLTAELDRGIKKTGEHNYEVQRATLDSLLGNMGALSQGRRASSPRCRTASRPGSVCSAIRPDGPFAKIGLQNGDVISAINGLEMTSPDQALEVYTKLKTANHLSVGARTQRPEDHQGLQHPMKTKTDATTVGHARSGPALRPRRAVLRHATR